MFAPDGTYREQHDGDSQRDGGEDSQADEQQHGVELVHLGEGVEQLRLYVVCVRGDAKEKNCEPKVTGSAEEHFLWHSKANF